MGAPGWQAGVCAVHSVVRPCLQVWELAGLRSVRQHTASPLPGTSCDDAQAPWASSGWASQRSPHLIWEVDLPSRKLLLLTMAASAWLTLPTAAQTCSHPPGLGTVWTQGHAVLFQSGKLNVDADGAPNAYLLNGKGLSYTCDGVLAKENGKRVTPDSHPADWQKKCNAAWALATTSGNYSAVAIFGFQTGAGNRPLVQGEGDPLPGQAYVSATSVSIPGAPSGTQRQYVDALKIPYIVLPAAFVSKYQVKPGTLAVVYRKKSNAHAFAVYADGGGLGEASIKLHQDLGGTPIVRIAGVDRAKARIEDPVLIAVFPETVASPQADPDAWVSNIQEQGATALQEFGGLAQLQTCAQ